MNVPTVPSEIFHFRLTCLRTRQRNERLGEAAGAKDLRISETERPYAGSFADKADISNEFMSAVERGAKLPSLDVLERIAAALKVEMKDLFNFDRSPYRKLELLPRDVMDLAVKMQALPSKHRRAIGKALKLFSNLDT